MSQLTDLFTGIAGAIRDKTGSINTYSPVNFSENIRALLTFKKISTLYVNNATGQGLALRYSEKYGEREYITLANHSVGPNITLLPLRNIYIPSLFLIYATNGTPIRAVIPGNIPGNVGSDGAILPPGTRTALWLQNTADNGSLTINVLNA